MSTIHLKANKRAWNIWSKAEKQLLVVQNETVQFIIMLRFHEIPIKMSHTIWIISFKFRSYTILHTHSTLTQHVYIFDFFYQMTFSDKSFTLLSFVMCTLCDKCLVIVIAIVKHYNRKNKQTNKQFCRKKSMSSILLEKFKRIESVRIGTVWGYKSNGKIRFLYLNSEFQL